MFSKISNLKISKIRLYKKFKEFYKDLLFKKTDKKNLINSFTKSYNYSFNKKQIKK